MILTNYAVKFRVAVITFTIVMALLGAMAYVRLPREGAPDIVIPYVFVTAVYEGVAPTEIENLITIPMEKQFNDLENLKHVTSTSSEGVSQLVVEFTPEADIDNALQRVKDKIDLARPDLPPDLDEPIVNAINFSTDWPVLMLALSGDADLDRLKGIADDLQDRIEMISGVKEAVVLGTREREIRVEVDPTRMKQHQVGLGLIAQAVAQENRTVSAGNLEMSGGKFQVRVPGEYEFVAPMRDIVVAVRNGKPIRLEDVARVRDTYKDLTSISRINGEPCVSLIIKKRSGENTVKLVERVRDVLSHGDLPAGIRLTTINDQSEDIAMQVADLENGIFSGFVFVVAVIVIFMGWRTSIFIASAIPLSLLLSFPVLQMFGMTLNMIVLFSLVLATGMLVDNAIVITENIYRHRSLGKRRTAAALIGASEVAWPVITSTLTTVVAFWPLLHWPSIIGQFMGYLPKTLIITLFSSLFVGIVINPAFGSLLIPAPRRSVRRDAQGEIIENHPFVQGYVNLVRGALKHRGLVLLLGVLLLVLSVQVYGRFGKGVELFPTTEPRRATISIEFPQGTDILKTDAAVRYVEEALHGFEDVEFVLANVGSSSGAGEARVGTHIASVQVEFLPMEKRSRSSLELVDTMRERIGSIPGATVVVDREQEGPPPKPPISIEVAGEDFDVLADLVARIGKAIRPIPGVVDVNDNLEDALPELQFRVDRQRAALLGVTTDFIGGFLRGNIFGLEASKLRAGEDEYDITLRLPQDQRASADLLRDVFVPVPGGATVPLSSLGEVVYTAGRGDIMRKDRNRVITVTGNLKERSIDAVLADVATAIGRLDLPRGYGVSYTGENEDMKESSGFLVMAFWMALAAIAVILVMQFNSVIVPAIIMTSVVLSLIGVMWGLVLCGLRFGVIMTGLGVISLAGVVVNNAIVLIDCINQRRAEGMAVSDAVVEAGRLRLRPVLLTAGTTVLGLLPMAMGWGIDIHQWPWRIVHGGESSSWWAPMAVSVIFGLAVATVLTLVLVPVMVSLADSAIRYLHRSLFPNYDFDA